MISTESGKKTAVREDAPAALPDPLPALGYSVGDIDFSAVLNAANSATGVDRLNLLGRQVKITVRDKNGEAIAESGEKITPEILSVARKNNLLLRLTVNTLTNIV